MGAKHSVLPGPPDHRPGGAPAVELERTVCVERCAVLDAPARRSATRRGGATRQSNGGR